MAIAGSFAFFVDGPNPLLFCYVLNWRKETATNFRENSAEVSGTLKVKA